jgi:poly-gamma-glutamate synthesis protein (capsule biosynthesis protein)
MKKYFIILAVLIVAVGLWIILPPLLHGDAEEETAPPPAATIPEPEQPVSLSISAVGDVMVHLSQINAQYDAATKTYNFDNNFEYVKSYIEKADLALCNLETTFAGGRYTGYPVFNTPDSLADALVKAGFDVAFTANNHIMDMGIDGMKRTLRIAREAGLATAGTQLEGEKDYVILTVKGVKIGIVAYLYETPEYEAIPTINSVPIPEDARPLLNTFNYDTLDEDLEKVKQSIDDARADGADIVICYFHWGEEYQRSPNEYQQYMAMQAAGFGADAIFASHPHVIQGMEMLTVAGTGRKVPVFYSMGNFISNQRTETLDIQNSRYTEQEIIAEVRMEYMRSTKEILSVEMDAVPLWVEKYKKAGKTVYYIIPLDSAMEENPALLESGHLSRAEQALADITNLLGEE